MKKKEIVFKLGLREIKKSILRYKRVIGKFLEHKGIFFFIVGKIRFINNQLIIIIMKYINDCVNNN